MSRRLRDRLDALEQAEEARESPGVVVIPWRLWPETEEEIEAMHRDHPSGRFFLPSPMTPEQWEAQVPMKQAHCPTKRSA